MVQPKKLTTILNKMFSYNESLLRPGSVHCRSLKLIAGAGWAAAALYDLGLAVAADVISQDFP